jgi:hypothetical protein
MAITIAITVVAVAWIMIGLAAGTMVGRTSLKGSCGGLGGGACACGKAPGEGCELEAAEEAA